MQEARMNGQAMESIRLVFQEDIRLCQRAGTIMNLGLLLWPYGLENI